MGECFVFNGIYVNATINNPDGLNTSGLQGLVSQEEIVSVLIDSCPSGYYCNATSGRPTACPAGTYQVATVTHSAALCCCAATV